MQGIYLHTIVAKKGMKNILTNNVKQTNRACGAYDVELLLYNLQETRTWICCVHGLQEEKNI
jgi:hypothetical protein